MKWNDYFGEPTPVMKGLPFPFLFNSLYQLRHGCHIKLREVWDLCSGQEFQRYLLCWWRVNYELDTPWSSFSQYIASHDPRFNPLESSGGLAAKHPALGAKGHRFDPSKMSKLFQRLISRLTTSWVADHVKWRRRLHWIIKIKKGNVKDPLRT